MYLLYADESGSAGNVSQANLTLGGFCCFERQGWWISQELDRIAARFNPAEPETVELHGSPMLSGRGFWRGVPRFQREQALADALGVLVASHQSARAFAIAVEKEAIAPEDPIEYAFEELCSRFDRYLMRRHRQGDTQRGVIVFDKSTYETSIQSLARDFRIRGHRWGTLRNLAEVPVFMDSRASRMVQLADLIAYATFLHFEKGNSRFFEIIRPRFDAEGGIVHGLCHYPVGRTPTDA